MQEVSGPLKPGINPTSRGIVVQVRIFGLKMAKMPFSAEISPWKNSPVPFFFLFLLMTNDLCMKGFWPPGAKVAMDLGLEELSFIKRCDKYIFMVKMAMLIYRESELAERKGMSKEYLSHIREYI
jgi:hypothetical protein